MSGGGNNPSKAEETDATANLCNKLGSQSQSDNLGCLLVSSRLTAGSRHTFFTDVLKVFKSAKTDNRDFGPNDLDDPICIITKVGLCNDVPKKKKR